MTASATTRISLIDQSRPYYTCFLLLLAKAILELLYNWTFYA